MQFLLPAAATLYQNSAGKSLDLFPILRSARHQWPTGVDSLISVVSGEEAATNGAECYGFEPQVAKGCNQSGAEGIDCSLRHAACAI
jgi:hypothetical protein